MHKKRIIITGATGFIGQHLCRSLAEGGYHIIALTRNREKASALLGDKATCVQWDSETTKGWQEYVEGAEVIINLGGANIGERLWTKKYRKIILNSRIKNGRAVVQAVRNAKQKPKLILQSSAIGIYGSRGDEELDETSPPGNGFLPDLVTQWEASVSSIEKYPEVRLAYLRTGVVLGRGGGMLSKLVLPFKMFLGGHPGDGRQWLSWIHIEDQIKVIRFLIGKNNLKGVFNLTAPEPVPMKYFCKEFAKVLKRPSWLPLPASLLSFAMQDLAKETILSSSKIFPKRILEAGYKFSYPTLLPALQDLVD